MLSDRGDILCEHLVNAGGTYARQMGDWSGLQLPMNIRELNQQLLRQLPFDDRQGFNDAKRGFIAAAPKLFVME